MTNKKSTKSALLTSSISLLLCFAMLLGTTFAWFTDSATSAGNKIMAGKLDIELYMHNGTDYVNISSNKAPIFGTGSIAQDNNAETLWEPGKTQVAYLKIANEGNLDLKYRVDVDVENVAKDLYKVMHYAIIPDAQKGSVTAWDANAGKSVDEGINITGYDNISLNKGQEHFFALALHMDEEAGNEYMDGQVNFDIIVSATQLNSEYDSFNNSYDEDAIYDTTTPVARTKAISKTETITNPEGTVVLGENLLVDTRGNLNGSLFDEPIYLDTAYQFQPSLTFEEVIGSEYEQWHADFVVSVDKDITEYNSIALAGYYDAWCSINNDKWVALSNDGFKVSAGEEIRLIDAMSEGNITVAYKDLSQYGNDGIGFLCGAYEIDDKLPENITLKVELRLYEATDNSRESETKKYITVDTYYYTFK